MIPPTWKKRAKVGLRVISQAAELLITVRNKPGVVACVAAGARVLDTLDQVTTDGLPRDRFDGWLFAQNKISCRRQVFSLCKNLGYLEPVGKHWENEQAYEGTLHGVKLGWVEDGGEVLGPWVECKDSDRAALVLRTLLWQEIGMNLTYCLGKDGWDYNYVARDRLDQAFPSQAAENLWLRVEKFLRQDKNRSVMLYGEPGTGKSHAIRHVAKQAGGLTLRLRATDFALVDHLGDVLNFLRPDAVMVDDLCKVSNTGAFTELIDEVRQYARLMLVTANDLTKLDAALLRRFDDSFEVQGIDSGVFAKMTEGFSPAIVERLQGLPTDWVAKYRELHDVLGPEKAELELDGILERREQVLKQMRSPPPRPSPVTGLKAK